MEAAGDIEGGSGVPSIVRHKILISPHSLQTNITKDTNMPDSYIHTFFVAQGHEDWQNGPGIGDHSFIDPIHIHSM